ncbi:MAG: hypothetical protein IKA32_12490 [Lentisphaeria bacterium]|nr:hypothetical protein [Lentisphaeria bacterium]
MPGKIIHRTITAQALASCKITDACALAQDYCCYPDFYFEEKSEEAAPYMFFYEGIQFHYPPHTPVEEFYRYWDHKDGRNILLSTRDNDNIRHVEAGFRYYLNKTVALLRENNRSEAWKYLGCLLHFLEDSTFGLHTLEGADGTDIFVLDRLSGTNVTKELCKVELPREYFSQTVEPEIISDNIEETVSLLFARYVRDSAAGRQALFDQAAALLFGVSQRDFDANTRIMFSNALSLTADTIATVIAIAENTAPHTVERKLVCFSPFHYPIGGSGGFGLRKFEETDGIVTFGTNSSAKLLYSIPANIYRRFSASVYGNDIRQLTLYLINNGNVIQTIELEKNRETLLEITAPGGTVGFEISSNDPSGKIEIRNAVFCREKFS